VNRQKPFNDALRIALRGDPLRLRRIADKLAALAEQGDLGAIRELADRLDGKPAAEKTHIESGGPIRVILRQIDVCPEEPLLLAKK
jgi:hypothetical protein